MKTIFITRNLALESVFRKKLEAAGFSVQGKSLLKFSAVPVTKVPKSEWIFFYSKNGVKYFFAGLKKSGKAIPQNIKWAAIGPGTAEALKTKVPAVHFTGSGNTVQTAAEFLKLTKKQTILFPQAQHSRQTIQRILEGSIIAKNLVVYNNEPKTRVVIPDCAILVFTSPMNAKAYFKKQKLFDDQKVFAIGRTTAKTLVSIGIEEFNIAEEPSEEALVQAILELK